MFKLLALLGVVFVTILSVGMLIALWPVMPVIAGLGGMLMVSFGSGLGLIYLYERLGRARLINAQALATTLEASKIADTTQALALPVGTPLKITLLPPRPSLPHPAAATITEPLPPLGGPTLPTAPALTALIRGGFQPTASRMLLGYTTSGPLWGSVEDLLSTAIAGRPKQGKTTLLRFIAAQLLIAGGKLVVLDPHGSLSDGAAGFPAEWIASTTAEMNDGADWLISELDSRLADYRRGQRTFAPLMVMADEWPVISLSSKNAVSAAQRVILEARKTNYYGLISGQGLPASGFGGSLARDALSSRYIFKTTSDQARYAGLDKETARLVPDLQPGVAIFEGPINPVIVAIPNVTGSDLESLLSQARPSRQPVTAGAGAGATDGGHSQTPSPYSTYATQENRDQQANHADPASPIITAQYRELPPTTLPARLQIALAAFQAGATSVDKLAAALGCSTGSASHYLQQLERLGYIRRPGRSSKPGSK